MENGLWAKIMNFLGLADNTEEERPPEISEIDEVYPALRKGKGAGHTHRITGENGYLPARRL